MTSEPDTDVLIPPTKQADTMPTHSYNLRSKRKYEASDDDMETEEMEDNLKRQRINVIFGPHIGYLNNKCYCCNH